MSESTEQARYEFECHYPNASEYRLAVGYSGPYAEEWEKWPLQIEEKVNAASF